MASTAWLYALCIVAGAVLATPALSATTVFRSVDDSGTVLFSDSPPLDGSAAEKIVIDTPMAQTDDLQQQRLIDMRTTTDRIAKERRAREQHRAQLRKENREARYANYRSSAAQDIYPVERYYRPYRQYRGYYPVTRPNVHPPLRTFPSRRSYPASLIRRHYQPEVRRVFEGPRY